jgi:hypothetical protein
MAGRRSHPRFAVESPWNGSLRILRDVAVHRSRHGELEAVSHAAAIAGETMTLNLTAAGRSIGLKVRVIDSRPVMIDGAVRHRIRLSPVEPHARTAQRVDPGRSTVAVEDH